MGRPVGSTSGRRSSVQEGGRVPPRYGAWTPTFWTFGRALGFLGPRSPPEARASPRSHAATRGDEQRRPMSPTHWRHRLCLTLYLLVHTAFLWISASFRALWGCGRAGAANGHRIAPWTFSKAAAPVPSRDPTWYVPSDPVPPWDAEAARASLLSSSLALNRLQPCVFVSRARSVRW